MLSSALPLYDPASFPPWGPADGHIRFCEPAYTRSTWIAEFYNAWSNLVPILGGLALAMLFIHDYYSMRRHAGGGRSSTSFANISTSKNPKNGRSRSPPSGPRGRAAPEPTSPRTTSRNNTPGSPRSTRLKTLLNDDPGPTSPRERKNPQSPARTPADTSGTNYRRIQPPPRNKQWHPVPDQGFFRRTDRRAFFFHILTAGCMINVGLGSFFFHASQRLWAELWDELALVGMGFGFLPGRARVDKDLSASPSNSIPVKVKAE